MPPVCCEAVKPTLKIKLGHWPIRTRPLGSETGQYRPSKKNILRTENKRGTNFPTQKFSILSPLSRSRIPAIRSTTYVRLCPAYRRRILHGQVQGPGRGALPDRAPVRQGLGDEARQKRPLD